MFVDVIGYMSAIFQDIELKLSVFVHLTMILSCSCVVIVEIGLFVKHIMAKFRPPEHKFFSVIEIPS